MKIVLLAVLAMFLVACGNNATEDTQAQESVQVEEQTATPALEAAEAEEVTTTEETTPKESEAVVEVTEAVEAVKEVVPVKEVEAPKVEEKKVVEAPKEVVKASIDGGALFAKCIACHGQNAEKKALGKSQIIQGWSADKVLTAFKGYKDGTYGGAMKGVMKSQIANYSEDELKALAEYISKL